MKPALPTPLALSILSFLCERPMHPYEIKHLMQARRHDTVIKLRGGSLYSTIDRLQADGLIVAIGASREGRRPERTTYALTPDGEARLLDSVRDAITNPVREFPHFGVMVAFLPHLMPSEAAALLRLRVAHLEADEARAGQMMRDAFWERMPRMFRVNLEYTAHMRHAEIAWAGALANDIETGAFAWPDVIVAWHKERGTWTEDAEAPMPGPAGEP